MDSRRKLYSQTDIHVSVVVKWTLAVYFIAKLAKASFVPQLTLAVSVLAKLTLTVSLVTN